MSLPGSGRHRSSSRLTRLFCPSPSPNDDRSEAQDLHNGAPAHAEISSQGVANPRAESSPSRASLPSSFNQKTPARSYYQRSFRGPHVPPDAAQRTSCGIREDTAELATLALSDVVSIRSGTPPPRHDSLASTSTVELNSHQDKSTKQDFSNYITGSDSGHIDQIEEVSEPASPANRMTPYKSPKTSVLTEMIRNSPPAENGEHMDEDWEDYDDHMDVLAVTVHNGIMSQPHEGASLLHSRAVLDSRKVGNYTFLHDIESLEHVPEGSLRKVCMVVPWLRHQSSSALRVLFNPKKWDHGAIWQHTILKPAGYVPPVVLGLLLNVLDALSYGMILFPLGQPVFASLGPDGISMFYVSCIVSQLVYSLGGSVFKGGVGSEMIEVVPFFHKMAFTILAKIGDDNPRSVIATTILSYSFSSILTGAIFYLMGKCKLGSLIGFFPRHILIGCIGGVGWFLVATGVEVSARLDGNLEYNLTTLTKLVQLDIIFLWIIPLVLAVILTAAKRWVKYALTDAIYFISIIITFHFLVVAIPDLNLDELRRKGWVFEAPEAEVPFYHFYSLYDFGAVDWKALISTVPAMFALTFFGVLHVPINIPALGLTIGEDNVDVNRELRAHGLSNALSGFCGSVQNYLVYANTVLFMRSGGESRVTGVLLAFGTFGILVIGPIIIGFIPIMVVGALIFFLGIDLMREALVYTWGKMHRLEYLTIVMIVVTMGAYDFVVGILVGIGLACASFVLQTSKISAVRGTLSGCIATSTVRRHPIQHRFLQEVGRQNYVMRLAGYLFFGTIVGVENRIRTLLHDDTFHLQPIRFLVIDFSKVDGVDFSAAEAFPRISRVLNVRNVTMIMCGFSLDGDVGKSLQNAGLLDKDNGVEIFKDLNSALEFCENELLKTLYQRRDALQTPSSLQVLDVPEPKQQFFPSEAVFSSPRRSQLHEVATMTLKEHQDSSPHEMWQQYEQPLQLILQTFSSVSDQDDDFWRRVTPFFLRQDYPAGAVLYSRGDNPEGFYLLEAGILKAEYKLPQGTYSELIVAGTTCGELPFFSSTIRTSTTTAERECTTWMLTQERWHSLQKQQPDIARELLKISLKLTSERMDAITKYMLLTAG